MNERCKRQQEFKELFDKLHGNPPYNRFYPIEYQNLFFMPKILKNKDFVKIRYESTNINYNYVYEVFIESNEYVKKSK